MLKEPFDNSDNERDNKIEIDKKLERFDEVLAEAINKSGTGEKVEKKREDISKDMSEAEIMEKYNVSKTTAWRAKKRGYVNVNYNIRITEPDLAWNNENEELIMSSAKAGVLSVMSKLAHLSGQTVEEFLRPYDVEDAVQEGALRIMEVSANPDRDSKNWLVAVAKIAAYKFLERMVKKAKWKSYDNANVSKIDTINGVIAEEALG